jgi:hypothetical protein
MVNCRRMSATQLHEHDSLDPRDARIARLEEIVAFQGALLARSNFRIDMVENLLGIPIPPDVDQGGLRLMVKVALPRCGLSESAVRKLIRENKIGHVWVCGRVFVTELPTRRR